MREILFRGKSIMRGEWIYGYLNQHRGNIRYDCDCEPIADGCYYINDWQTKIETGMYGQDYKVDSSTVGRFTGLTDRNGVKIFEGDIIRWHDNTELSVGGQIAEVCFGKYRDADSAFDDVYAIGFYLRTSGGECVTICWLDEYQNDFDIIGNIYDNPELLEVSGNE